MNGHVHHVEGVHGPTGAATVVADIGGDTGAAIVYTPAALVGEELLVLFRRGDQITVKPVEVAVDLLFADCLLDEIDGGAVCHGAEPCGFLTADAGNVGEAVVNHA